MPEPPPIQKIAPRSRKETKGETKLAARTASFFCPGIGQIIQRRYFIGLVQLFLFLLAWAVSFIALFSWAAANSRIAWNLQENPGQDLIEKGPWLTIAGGIFFALLVLVWSVWDAGRESHRNQ